MQEVRAPGQQRVLPTATPGCRTAIVRLVSRTVRAVVCTELGPLDNVVIEERATPAPGRGPGGRGRAGRRRELRRRAHLPGSLPDEAGRPLRAGWRDRRCRECRRRRRHAGDGRGPGHGHDRASAPSPSRSVLRGRVTRRRPRRARLRPGRRLHPELLHGVVRTDTAHHGRRGRVGSRARGRGWHRAGRRRRRRGARRPGRRGGVERGEARGGPAHGGARHGRTTSTRT